MITDMGRHYTGMEYKLMHFFVFMFVIFMTKNTDYFIL